MGIVHLAFDGVAWIGTFVIVHFFVSFLLKDRTNIDFWTPIGVVLIPSFILYYGIPAEGVSLSARVVIVIVIAILLAWFLAYLLTHLTWQEDFAVGIVAVGSYLMLYAGVKRLWTKTFLT